MHYVLDVDCWEGLKGYEVISFSYVKIT
jgi:hypothetical protein